MITLETALHHVMAQLQQRDATHHQATIAALEVIKADHSNSHPELFLRQIDLTVVELDFARTKIEQMTR